MYRQTTILLCGLLLLAGTTAHGKSQQARFYVASNGNDAWSGRIKSPNRGQSDGPFATLQRAQEEVRKLKAHGKLTHGVEVLIRGGIYRLSQPLMLSPEDSGTAHGAVVYAAYPGEKVSLTGSRSITGWKPFRGKIYRADLTGVDLGSTRFWQLFHGGKRQILARYPNVDPQHPRSGGFLYVRGEVEPGSKTLLEYDARRLDVTKWSKPADVRVHIWPWLNWNRNICPVKQVDPEKHVITLAAPASYMISPGNRFFVENALEELDSPGEWYYDADAKQLYFWPPDGKNPEGKVSVPVLPSLVQIRGEPTPDRFVRYVRIEHLELAETHDQLVTMSFADHCAVVGCTLTDCGGTALSISDRSHHNEVVGCDIAHVGGSAITLDGVVDWTHSLENRISYNLISNNHVHDVGENGNAWGAIMINPGCGGNCTHDNVISHNLIHDTPRQGITFNGFRNIVEYNVVHHTNQEQSDTGAIGMGSRDIEERGSIIRYNSIHDTGGYSMIRPGLWEYPHYCWGIYLDDYTSGVHVYGNLIVRAQRAGVMVHGGQDNVIENNIIVDSQSQQIEYAPIDSLTFGRTPANPNKAVWLMKGTRLLRNIFYYSNPQAAWVHGSKWSQVLAESDGNLVWHKHQPVTVNLQNVDPTDAWAAWLKSGYDAHSIIADPRFVNPAKDDYRLRPDSPAFKLGFKPLPIAKAGLFKSPDRASWPVSDNEWHETHLTQPEGAAAAALAPRTVVPTARAVRLSTPPRIDGIVDSPEWSWDTPGAKLTVEALSLGTGKGKQPSYALVGCDREALYVALSNKVSATSSLVRQGGTWGRDDGAEICIQDASGKAPGPVFAVQGYPSGKCESVNNAGAPAAAVKKLGQAVTYQAHIGNDSWSGEWRIPFAALGVDPARTHRLLFNIGVLKAAEQEWIAWVSTGSAPWHMDLAGQLLLP